MRRTIVLKNTATGQVLTLPVTPKSYPMEAGRAVEKLDMAVTGQIALPGLRGLFSGTLEFWLPARAYPFLNAGAVTQPQYYIGTLTAWAQAGSVCRYIVTGTDVNVAVLLGMVEYGEDDGTNDVSCKLPMTEYRFLSSAVVVRVTQNSQRPADAVSKPQTAGSYTVKAGDSLWAICQKMYGDGSLAYKLATANGVKNPNLIYPGQVLSIPGGTDLGGYAPTPAPRAVQVTPAAQEAAKQVDISTAPAGTLDLSKTFSGSKSFGDFNEAARKSLFMPRKPL